MIPCFEIENKIIDEDINKELISENETKEIKIKERSDSCPTVLLM